MARRQILSLSERESLLALPDDELTLTRMAYFSEWICPYISRHLLSLNPLLARCRRYSRGER